MTTNFNTYTIEIAYEGSRQLETYDMVAALKIASNYEADLYRNGKLVYSAMGLSHEENKELVSKYDVEMYVTPNGDFTFKHLRGNDNTELFAELIEYKKNGIEHVEIHYNNYNFGDAVQFNDYNDMIDTISLLYYTYKPENVLFLNLNKESENYCTSKTLATLKEMR